MREYLFRGQRVDNGEWVYGDLIHNDNTHFPMTLIGSITMSKNKYTNELEFDGYCLYEVIPETVGQFTGLTDKNGKKIFEGDLINIVNSNKQGLPAVVRFNNRRGSYELGRNGYNPIMLDYSEEIEVIGNIHDTKGDDE